MTHIFSNTVQTKSFEGVCPIMNTKVFSPSYMTMLVAVILEQEKLLQKYCKAVFIGLHTSVTLSNSALNAIDVKERVELLSET